MKRTATRGVCPKCGRKYALTDIGLIRHHTTDGKRESAACPGSWGYPKEKK